MKRHKHASALSETKGGVISMIDATELRFFEDIEKLWTTEIEEKYPTYVQLVKFVKSPEGQKHVRKTFGYIPVMFTVKGIDTMSGPRDFISDESIKKTRKNGWLSARQAEELHNMGPKSCRSNVSWGIIESKMRRLEQEALAEAVASGMLTELPPKN